MRVNQWETLARSGIYHKSPIEMPTDVPLISLAALTG